MRVVIAVLWMSRVWCQHMDIYRAGWVDPTDMLDYDPSTKTVKKKMEYGPSKQRGVQPCCLAFCPVCPEGDLQKQITDIADNVFMCERKRAEDSEKCQMKPSVDASIYFRQYIRFLLTRIPTVLEGRRENLIIGVTLSSDDIKSLQNYSYEVGSIYDALDVLLRMVQDVSLRKSDGYAVPNICVYAKTMSQLFLLFGVTCFGLYFLTGIRLSVTRLGIYMLFLVFLVSFPWNWLHLYYLESAKRLAKLHQKVPPQCDPKNMGYGQTFMETMRHWFSVDQDHCAEYYQHLMVHPMWTVPPIKAVVITVTKFFVDPLEIIGIGMGEFVKATLRGLPVQLWPVVLVATICIFLVVLFLLCGYKVNILGPLVSVGPAYRPVEAL